MEMSHCRQRRIVKGVGIWNCCSYFVMAVLIKISNAENSNANLNFIKDFALIRIDLIP